MYKHRFEQRWRTIRKGKRGEGSISTRKFKKEIPARNEKNSLFFEKGIRSLPSSLTILEGEGRENTLNNYSRRLLDQSTAIRFNFGRPRHLSEFRQFLEESRWREFRGKAFLNLRILLEGGRKEGREGGRKASCPFQKNRETILLVITERGLSLSLSPSTFSLRKHADSGKGRHPSVSIRRGFTCYDSPKRES